MTSDERLTDELAEICARLADLAWSGDRKDAIGLELGAIRDDLRRLAAENAEIGMRLAVALGLQTPPH